MNEFKLMLRRGNAIPVLALLLASVAAVFLVGLRVWWTGNWRYLWLVWNLYLAWLPLLFAMAASRRYKTVGGWGVYAMGALWLLFFPNAPYVFTDFVHLNNWPGSRYLVDLCLVLLFGFTAFVLGFLSLYLMQSLVAGRFGRVAGWCFIAAVAALSGVGVFFGRVLRFNSWDVVAHPLWVTHGIKYWAGHPLAHPGQYVGFPLLFATFLFLAYLMLYGLTHLRPGSLTNAASAELEPA
jgi:uncharacterized membrane protein